MFVEREGVRGGVRMRVKHRTMDGRGSRLKNIDRVQEFQVV